MSGFTSRVLNGGSGDSFTARVLGGGRRRNSQLSLPELRQQVRELERESEQYGAPGIAQDKPGIFTRIIDVLSRPNYAVAGLTEELLNGRSVTSGVARAMQEILSGVGDIQGQKRAFGQVLEGQGVGTKTLADAFPALEGTWVGAFGSRGAAGLALDIATDPLTYVTFGASGVGRVITTRGAQKFLNPRGMDELGAIRRDLIEGLSGGVRDAATRDATEEGLSGGVRDAATRDATEERLSGGVRDAATRDATEIARTRFAKQLFGTTDEFSKNRALIRIENEAMRRFEARFASEAGEFSADVLQEGGARFFGQTIPLTPEFARSVKPATVRALSVVPGGDRALAGAKWMNDGIRKSLRGLFHPHNELGSLPAELAPGAIKLRRDFVNSSAAHRGRLRAQAGLLENEYRRLEKVNPGIGKLFTDIREGVTRNTLEGDELALYTSTMKMYDQMGATLVAHGVLDPKQIRGGYLFHNYENVEDLTSYHWAQGGPFQSSVGEMFTKLRAFDKVDDAVRESQRLNRISARELKASGNPRLYPELRPEYDVFKNLGRYIDLHSDALARKAWQEEALAKFGIAIDKHDITALYEVSKPLSVLPKVQTTIDNWFGKHKDFEGLAETAGEVLSIQPISKDIRAGILALDRASIPGVEARSKFGLKPRKDLGLDGVQRKRVKHIAEKLRLKQRLNSSEMLHAHQIVVNNRRVAEQLTGKRLALEGAEITRATAEKALLGDARRVLGKLDNDGKREFLRRMLVGSKSASQLAMIEGQLWDDYSKFFPRDLVKHIPDGEIERTLQKMHGNAAEYVNVKSAFGADRNLSVPKIIFDDLASMPSNLLNTQDHAAFGKLLDGFDWLNNKFKLGVYTLWPASAVRDAYSNIALSMLDIGMGAMNPRQHMHTVAIMAGRNGFLTDKNGIKYSYESLRQMFKDFNIIVPGQVFVEETGKAGLKKSKAMHKLLTARASIENEARAQLAINNILRGVSPREAADHVADFLFNYGEVSRVEREVFRRLIPFYTFARKNIERQVKTLKSKPGLAINQVKPFRKRDDESEMMVKWEAESLGIRLNRDGKTVHMIQGIDLPLRNLDTLYAGGFGATGRRIFGMISPILKVPVEVIAQRDFFTGGDLKRTRGDTMGRIIESTGTPQSIKDWIGYKKDHDAAGRPRYTFDGTRYALLVRSWAFSRFFSTSDRQFREYLGDQQTVESFVDVLTGLRPKQMDLNEQERRRLGNRVRQLEDALARRGRRETFTKSFERRGAVARY